METSAPKIYEKCGYIILKVKKGYIVYNTSKPFSQGHTHLRSFSMAKTLIDNCIKHKKPKSFNLYIITSHIRVANDEKYIKFLKELLKIKKDQKDKYYNSHK
mgnify:CR=1 FL=1